MKGKLTTTQTLTGRQAIAGGGSGGPVTWDKVKNKPFNTVDTEGGLAIYDDTLMIDTLDKIATIEYVDSQVDGITTTLTEDYALKSEIPTVPTDVSAFNNDAGYITSTDVPTPDWNATTGQDGYIDNKPAIKAGTGSNSIVEGHGTIDNSFSSGEGTHVEGSRNQVSGNAFGAHIEGIYNNVGLDDGHGTHVEGSFSRIGVNSGDDSGVHIEGDHTLC